jgi:hypothetical protein
MPAVSQHAPALGRRRESRAARGPARAVAGRVFRGGRVLTLVFAYLFAVYSFIQPAGYRRTYPALASRLAFARDSGATRGSACFTVSRVTW